MKNYELNYRHYVIAGVAVLIIMVYITYTIYRYKF